MTKLFLARHGESQWNIEKKIQGQHDTVLTLKGIDQAENLAQRLYKEEIKHICCSDLKRAYQTAKIVGNRIGVRVEKFLELREIHFGCWQGLSTDEIKLRYHEEHLLWMTEPHKLRIPGAETLIDAQERILKAVNNIIDEHRGENILVVSHGAAIKALILGILDIDLSNYNKLALDNVGLTIIEYRNYNPVIKVFNDTCHIKEV